MDLIANHIQEIKTIGMLALGIFCYVRLRKTYQQPLDQQISEQSNDQQIKAVLDQNRKESSNANSPKNVNCEGQVISEDHDEIQAIGQLIEQKGLYQTSQLDKENMTGCHHNQPKTVKRKFIRRLSKKPRRKILGERRKKPKQIDQQNPTVMII